MEIQYGEKLKEARVEKNLSLEDVSDQLKINLRTLRKIEESKTVDLPKAPFTRGFLKTYSQYLAIDSKAVIEAYNETLGEPQNKLKKGVLTENGNKEAVFALDFFKEKIFPFILLTSTLVGALVVYSFLKQEGLSSSNSQRVEVTPVIEAPAPVKPLEKVIEPTKEVEKPKVILKPKKINHVATVYTGAKKVKKEKVDIKEKKKAVQKPVVFANKLVVEPLAKTALYIKTNLDDSPVKATLKSDKKRVFRFDKAEIRFLDAGAVNIILNGKDLGALGGFGEVKKIEFPSLKEL